MGLSMTTGQALSHTCHDDVATWSRGTAPRAERQHCSGICRGDPPELSGATQSHARGPRGPGWDRDSHTTG